MEAIKNLMNAPIGSIPIGLIVSYYLFQFSFKFGWEAYKNLKNKKTN